MAPKTLLALSDDGKTVCLHERRGGELKIRSANVPYGRRGLLLKSKPIVGWAKGPVDSFEIWLIDLAISHLKSRQEC